MSEATGRVGRFAERYGIDRKRATIGAALLAGVLLVSLWVMNQRIQDRRASAAEAADSAAVPVPVLEADEPSGERAAWADPREARKLAGDTLPVVPDVDSAGGGEYVPIGRDVGPDAYGETSLGEAPSVDSADAGAYGPAGGLSAEPRPPTPQEVRRALFQRAVAARQLRPGKPAAGDSAGGLSGITAPGALAAPELRPYGPEQVEEDRRAAEQAAQQLGGRPQAAAATGGTSYATFASFSAARPCRVGERILSTGMITVTLVSGVDSEHPGPVFARIGRDVYDASLRCVIIPAGALLVGRYADGLEIAGRRLAVVWEQVVLGDGRAWALPAFPSADRQGSIGVPGEVDRRTRETFETVALLSAFGAALEYATPGWGESSAVGPGGYPAAPSARDRAVGAAAEPIRGAAGRLLERATSIRPVLRLRPGEPIAVIIPAAVDLDRPPPAPRPAPPPPHADSTQRQPAAPTA
jgi:type IV secretion system protein VirB10